MDFLKFLLHVFNIVFTIVGIVLLGIGIWQVVDKVYFSAIIGDTLFSSASYMAIAVGVVTSCVSILGIYAVAKGNLRLVMVFFGCMVLSALLMLVGGILAVVFKTEMESAMVDQMRKTLINGYGSDQDVTDAWDKVQAELRCCAISQTLVEGGSSLYIGPYADGSAPTLQKELDLQDSWPIYKRTDFYAQQKDLPSEKRKFVPKSCCVYKSGDYMNTMYCQNFPSGPPYNYAMQLDNSYLYYPGCYSKARDIVMESADILLALGFAFGVLMIGGIVLTFVVLRQMSEEDDEDLKRRRQPDNL